MSNTIEYYIKKYAPNINNQDIENAIKEKVSSII